MVSSISERMILKAVGGWDGEVAFLVADLVAEIPLGVGIFLAAVPEAFVGIDVVVAVVVRLVEADAVQNIKLRFGAEVTPVGDLGGFQISLGLFARCGAGRGNTVCP